MPNPALSERVTAVGTLLAVLVGHGLVGWWLLQTVTGPENPVAALQISFIEAMPVAEPPSVPAFPIAPLRPTTRHPAAPRRATASAAPDPPRAIRQGLVDSGEPEDPARRALRLRQAIDSVIQQDAPAMTRRDPMRHRPAAIAGRAESYTPNPIVLREAFKPEDLVKAVGMLFGGNYDPCPDTISRIHDLSTRNEPGAEAELALLIDRERRRGCR